MKRRLKNPKEAAEYRKELLAKQKGIDPVIGIEINNPVLDHYHEDSQHCRQVLQNEVNAFEGKVVNSYKRMLSHLTDKSVYEVLRSLADYLEKNNNIPDDEKVIHHTALTKDVNKFKRLPAKTQISVLESFGIVPESNTNKRAKQARKLIRDNLLDINAIKKGE